MKIKIGQWYRYNNKIRQVDEMLVKMANDGVFNIKYKIEDTPQELIEVGDLVELILPHDPNIKEKALVLDIDSDYINVDSDYIYTRVAVVKKELITEIWTRINNDTYKCQWRKYEKD